MSDSPIEVDRRGKQLQNGSWADEDGFVGPLQPGSGARISPLGAFPTGPAVGERLPDIVAPDASGRMVNVHEARGDGPAVVDFYRSAVW